MIRFLRYACLVAVVTTLSAPLFTTGAQTGIAQPATAAEALKILTEVPVIDGHNDVPWQYHERAANHLEQIDLHDTTGQSPKMHTDFKRLEGSGLGAQFWSVYIPTRFSGPGAARKVLEQIDVVHRLAERYPDELEMAYTAQDIRRIQKTGKIASLIGMEGGHSIENSLGVLRQLYRSGARYMTLTHSANTDWADSATDKPEHNGLTEFGNEVVREMNRLGMLVDLSHVSPKTMHDALNVSAAPVMFSHSSAYAVTPHPRNVPDGVLERIPENGGIVMVTFVPSFVNTSVMERSRLVEGRTTSLKKKFKDDEDGLAKALAKFRADNPPPKATLQDVADHIDHLRKKVGVNHIGIGSDFDGISSVPVGLEDVSKYPDLFAELLNRGYSAVDLMKISGLNMLRVLQDAENASAVLRQENKPSDALIEELDAVGKTAGKRNDLRNENH